MCAIVQFLNYVEISVRIFLLLVYRSLRNFEINYKLCSASTIINLLIEQAFTVTCELKQVKAFVNSGVDYKLFIKGTLNSDPEIH